MVESVDAQVLKTCALWRVGSSPTSGTINNLEDWLRWIKAPVLKTGGPANTWAREFESHTFRHYL